MKREIQRYLGRSLVCVSMLMVAGCATSPLGGGIDGETRQVLKRTAKFFSTQNNLAYKASGFLDVRQEDGSLVQEAEAFTVHFQRPSKLRLDAQVGGKNLTLWFESGRVVVLDRGSKQVAHMEAAKDVDSFMDELIQKYGASFPGQDLLRAEPGSALKTGVTSGVYVGLEADGDQNVHHLALMQGSAAWELWVQDAEQPLPRRFTLVEMHQPGRPHYEVEFSDWNTDPVRHAVFIPELPAGSKPVSIDKILGAMEIQP